MNKNAGSRYDKHAQENNGDDRIGVEVEEEENDVEEEEGVGGLYSTNGLLNQTVGGVWMPQIGMYFTGSY